MTRMGSVSRVVGIAVYLTILWLVLAHMGEAQDERAPIGEELALARLCASEAGLRTDVDDCPALDAVIRFRAQLMDVSYLESIERYTRGALGPERRARYAQRGRRDLRPWIAHLEVEGDEPIGWPDHLVWRGRHARAWARLLEHARDIRAGRRTHRCELDPHAWGAPSISARYVRRNPDADRARCGRSLNHFWSLERYRERWTEGS